MTDRPEEIDKFVSSGLDVHYAFAKKLCREELAPYFIDILRADEYWDRDGPGDGWTPIHIIHLLPEIGSEGCLRIFIETVKDREEELGEWLTEDVPALLARFGPSAKTPALKLLSDRKLSQWVRSASARSLVVLAKHTPEGEDEILDAMREVLEEGGDLADSIVVNLAQFQRDDVFEDIRRAYKKGRVEPKFATFKDIQEIYNSSEEELDYHRDESKGLDHFLPRNIQRLWKRGYTSGKPSKVDRNEDCPCGSGRKFKRCCLPEIREREKEIYG